MTAALATALAGCGAEPPAEAEGRDLVRPDLGFAVNVPEGWTWKDLAGDVVLEIVPGSAEPRPAGDHRPAEAGRPEGANETGPAARRRTRPVIHVAVVDREGMSLAAWADEAVAAGRELQADLEVLSREPTRLADGRPALALVLKNPRGLEPFVQRMRLAVTETRACAVIATAPESDWPAAEPAVETCFDSFVVW